MEKIIIAALAGLSLGSSWICGFISFSMGSTKNNAGKMFIIGRFIGICCLGIFIGAFGYNFGLSEKLATAIFGILIIIFGILVLFRERIYLALNLKTKEHKYESNSLIKWLGRGGLEGFGLGMFRGATPCLKILILTPLLIVSDITTVVLMVVVFALVSSVYPLIGLLSANLLEKIVPQKNLKLIGSVMLITIGTYYIIRYLLLPACGGYNV
ncbi:MAG: hypothetical protein AB1485_08040 [Candidatus Thermoplasmatota archaeon]